MEPQGGNYLYLQREKKLVPAGPGEPWDGTLTKEDLALAERYRLWCQSAYHFYGDCLGGALVAGRYLDMQGRYVWALAMSKSPVLDEMKKALGEMVEFRALISAALWTLGSRGQCRGRQHHATRERGGHGGAAQSRQGALHRDAPHRHPLQRQIHRTRWPMDAAIPVDLRPSRDDAE
jgi:hypothetical protein